MCNKTLFLMPKLMTCKHSKVANKVRYDHKQPPGPDVMDDAGRLLTSTIMQVQVGA